MNINVTFCRLMLRQVMEDVKPLTTGAERKDSWVYRCMKDHWEFHGPAHYYWHGEADNAYDARAKGWSAWLEQLKADAVMMKVRAVGEKKRAEK